MTDHVQITKTINLPPYSCELVQSSELSHVQLYSSGPYTAEVLAQVHEPNAGEKKRSKSVNQ